MAYMATTVHQPTTNTPPAVTDTHSGSLLTALVLSVYAAQKSTKQMRRLKRKAAFMLLKLKMKASFEKLFSDKKEIGGISTTTLLYILLGLLVLILLLTLPATVAIIVLLVGILLLLLTRR